MTELTVRAHSQFNCCLRTKYKTARKRLVRIFKKKTDPTGAAIVR